MQARPYQRTAINSVMGGWRDGIKDQLLVSPTGSGKTFMGGEICNRAVQAGVDLLWTVHRTELVNQAKKHLHDRGLLERATVDTVQGLLASGRRPDVGLVVFDEAHHFPANEWLQLPEYYRDVRTLGLTATPQRADGKPLGALFNQMTVAAQYSELIDQDHIVDCRVFQPPETLQGLALDPVEAYRRYGDGGPCFCFCATVPQTYELAERFTAAGFPAHSIEAKTRKDDRWWSLELFKEGSIQILTNVYVLTEGVDVPRASVCLLARGCGFVSTYLQMVGRVLRPFEGKEMATLIDLPGASLTHGMPTEDRYYRLDGGAIERRDPKDSIKVCLKCAYTYLTSQGPACPNCGYYPPPGKKEPRIYNKELREVYRGVATEPAAKRAELDRLKQKAGLRQYPISWVAKQYRELFGTNPPASWFDEHELYEEWCRVKERWPNHKQALAIYKQAWGTFPKKDW